MQTWSIEVLIPKQLLIAKTSKRTNQQMKTNLKNSNREWMLQMSVWRQKNLSILSFEIRTEDYVQLGINPE